MRLVFKIIAIIGVLSFLGGLKNNVFFIFGLILAGLFGYLGWRPKVNIPIIKNPSKKDEKSNFFSRANINLNFENGFYKTIENSSTADLLNKIKILENSHKEGLLTDFEYESKSKEINKLINHNQYLELNSQIIASNKLLFEKLDKLYSNGLIDLEELNTKRNNLLNKIRNESNKSKNKFFTSELKNNGFSITDNQIVVIVCFATIIVLFLITLL
jgi:hypothetical protein